MIPKVSVIIPVYNSVQYLRICIESVIKQTLNEIEIICINDGSTDGSLDILREYEKKDNRITVIDQENKGAGAARNAGLNIAKGEYLAFLDSDDFFDLNMLKYSYDKAIEYNADIVLVGTNYINKENKLTDAHWFVQFIYLPEKQPFSRKDIPQHIFTAISGHVWNKIFKNEFIISNNIKFKTTKRLNDVYFVLLALVSAERITTKKEKLIFYRNDVPTSITNTRNKTLEDSFNAFYQIKKELEYRNIYNEVEQSFIYLLIKNLIFVFDSLTDGNEIENYFRLLTIYSKEFSLNINNYEFKLDPNSTEYNYTEQYLKRFLEITNKTAVEFLFGKWKSTSVKK